MLLTTENAAQFLGKSLDSRRRLFHHYPLTVQQKDNGKYYFVDAYDVAIPVPEPNDKGNSVSFDFVDGEEIEAQGNL